jgi:hypothetical protein
MTALGESIVSWGTGPDSPDCSEVVQVARLAARDVQERAPGRCQRWRLDPVGLASDLGVEIRTRHALPVPARWYRVLPDPRTTTPQLWEERCGERAGVDVIEVRSDLRSTVRRFAIAHELGHAVLDRHSAGRSTDLQVEDQERFANEFATELLIPRVHRTRIARDFRAASHPREVLDLAGSVGVPPRILMRFARERNWLLGIDRVWLDVRLLPNRFTRMDPRLRVFDAVLDRARWYVPGNRSIRGMLGTDAWLTDSTVRTCTTHAHMDISRYTPRAAPRYVRCSVPARIAALRLGTGAPSRGMQFLATAELQPRA